MVEFTIVPSFISTIRSVWSKHVQNNTEVISSSLQTNVCYLFIHQGIIQRVGGTLNGPLPQGATIQNKYLHVSQSVLSPCHVGAVAVKSILALIFFVGTDFFLLALIFFCSMKSLKLLLFRPIQLHTFDFGRCLLSFHVDQG